MPFHRCALLRVKIGDLHGEAVLGGLSRQAASQSAFADATLLGDEGDNCCAAVLESVIAAS